MKKLGHECRYLQFREPFLLITASINYIFQPSEEIGTITICKMANSCQVVSIMETLIEREQVLLCKYTLNLRTFTNKNGVVPT